MQVFLHKTVSVAQRKGFEPLYTFLHNTISNRARSTAPPSLQTAFILYTILLKKSSVFVAFFRNFLPLRKFYLHNGSFPLSLH